MYETEDRADMPKQPGEAGQLEGELERLTDTIQRLESVLAPALGPERPVSSLIDRVEEGSSHLRSLRLRLASQTERINTLIARLEL